MTKVQNPIVGRSRGSAGGMTFTKTFGKNVMRTKPFEVSNPKTTAQTTQRDFFKQVQSVTASVTDEQLRSLFGDMPKGMSRRNALSKQIAAAYSIDGTTKSVDFSKLESIGNGEKVTTPYVEYVEGSPVGDMTITKSMLNVSENKNPNIIIIAFDTENQKIILFNTGFHADDGFSTDDIVQYFLDDFTGFVYATCDSMGEDVSAREFGSFILKCRKTKTGQNTKGETPQAGNVVSLSASTIGSTATLSFANYAFNNLVPGDLIQGETGSEVTLVSANDWEEGSNNEFGADLAVAYDNTKATYLQILQGGDVVDTVPFAVVVE